MSLKAIELQIALPRTHDAGKIQEQLQNRGQQLIEHAAEQEKKSAETKNKTVHRQEKNNPAEWKNHPDDRQQKNQRQNDEEEKNHSAFSQAKIHPYKGKQIDTMG